MHTVEIPDIKFKASYPSRIDELTPEQYIRFLPHAIDLMSGTIEEEDFRTLLLFDWLDIKPSHKYRRMPFREFVHDNIRRLTETLDSFFIEDEEGKRSLDFSTVKNIMPTYRRLHGPADALSDITFREYIDAHDAFIAFAQDQVPAQLDKLVSILYRKRRCFMFLRKKLSSWNGRMVRKYNPNHASIYLRDIKRVPDEVKFGVFMFMKACEEFIRTGKPVVAGNEIDLSILYEGDSSGSRYADVGLVGVLYSMADNGAFGNVEQTGEQNLWDILIRLYQVVKESKDMEERIKKERKN